MSLLKQKGLILTLTGLALCYDVAHSQYIPTVEEGKEWTIQFSFGLGNYSYVKYTLWCDTMIQGNNYLSLYKETDNKIVGFIREDTSLQIVYYLPVNAVAEEILLSYQGEAGDTIHLNTGDFAIQEVYYDSLFGETRKVIACDSLITLIEGAGTTRYGIISDLWPPGPPPFLFDLQMSTDGCESITSTFQPTEAISIYPNPFTDFIILATPESPHGYYELYNSLGTQLLYDAFTKETTIDTKALAPGMYLLVFNRKIIKMIKQ